MTVTKAMIQKLQQIERGESVRPSTRSSLHRHGLLTADGLLSDTAKALLRDSAYHQIEAEVWKKGEASWVVLPDTFPSVARAEERASHLSVLNDRRYRVWTGDAWVVFDFGKRQQATDDLSVYDPHIVVSKSADDESAVLYIVQQRLISGDTIGVWEPASVQRYLTVQDAQADAQSLSARMGAGYEFRAVSELHTDHEPLVYHAGAPRADAALLTALAASESASTLTASISQIIRRWLPQNLIDQFKQDME